METKKELKKEKHNREGKVVTMDYGPGTLGLTQIRPLV